MKEVEETMVVDRGGEAQAFARSCASSPSLPYTAMRQSYVGRESVRLLSISRSRSVVRPRRAEA